jgi:hypothetical protein
LLATFVIAFILIIIAMPKGVINNNILNSVYATTSQMPFPRILNAGPNVIDSSNNNINGYGNTSNIAKSPWNETSSGLEVTTDKKTYMPGEKVTITVKNNGKQPLTFPDAALGLKIENLDTKERFGLVAAQVLTTVEPGQSEKIEWDQKGNLESQAAEGLFNATVTTVPDEHLSSLNAGVIFRIRK